MERKNLNSYKTKNSSSKASVLYTLIDSQEKFKGPQSPKFLFFSTLKGGKLDD